MVAPGVEVDSVTLCAVVYVPLDGLKPGDTTVPVGILIVYVALVTLELFNDASHAIAFNVVVLVILTAELYLVPVVQVGLDPSVVYSIVEPSVLLEMVTLCAVVYVPPGVPNAGADIFTVIANTTLLTLEAVIPLLHPMALIVLSAVIEIGLAYNVPVVHVGVVPLVVYWMVAPVVVVDIATVVPDVTSPPGGEKVGTATVLTAVTSGATNNV